MDSSNLNILVEAKKEYMFQLATMMCPSVIDSFQDMYTEAKKLSKGRKVLLQFQKLLKEVVNWNNHMVHQHAETICNSCAYFNDLLAAVFVSYVKIYSSVRLNTENKKISIKLPTNDVFIHGCYVNVAKEFYKDPYIFYDEMTDYEREDKMNARIIQCIESTIKENIPIQDILKAYISQDNKRDLDVLHDDAEDTEDPDVEEDDFSPDEVEAPPEEIAPPETMDQPGPLSAPEPVGDSEPVEREDNLKNIDLTNKGFVEDESDDVLFPGAPEH
jgi:hypothetical protein